MASGTLPTRPGAESSTTQGRYEDFIQKRLEHTRRQVRLGDVACHVMLLATASLVFFLAVAVLDQWVVHDGLSFLARFALFVAWVAAAGVYSWRFLVPPLARRINPVFAAQTIEHGRPALKNSLINFFLLRAHQEDVAPVVYRAMEHRAAADLLKVPEDHAVDRSRIVKLACVLAGIVAAFALYLAISPKNPLVSAGRVLFPWSSMPVPTRVHIGEVEPGNDIVFNEETREIRALVTGLRDDEEVALLVNTADNQAAEDRIVMTRSDDAGHFRSELPPASGGFQQDTFYRIVAGDAKTEPYKLEFHTAPTILIDSVDYHFPPYTEMPDRTIKNQGDIKALEGTWVTIHATANADIKEARIDVNCDGLRASPMTVTGAKATGRFKLDLDANTGKAETSSYQILFTDADGHAARRPIRYSVEVDRDLSPEITIVEPKEDNVNLADDGELKIRVKAFDPDYALRRMALQAERQSQLGGEPEKLNLPVLLDRPKPEKAKQSFAGEYSFHPAEWHLKAGDVVRYWATADDNKEPRANQSIFPPAGRQRSITIRGAGQEGQPGQDGQGGAGNPQHDPRNQGQNGQAGEKGQPGQQGQGSGLGKPDGTHGDQTEDNTSKPDGTSQSSNDPKKGDGNNTTGSQKSDGGKPSTDKKDPQGKSDSSTNPDGVPDKGGPSGSDPNSNGGSDEHEHQKVDQGTQGADAMRDTLKDLENQRREEQGQQNQPNQSDPSGGKNQDQGPRGANQKGGTQQSGPQQANQDQSGGQGTQKPQDNSNTGPSQGGKSNLGAHQNGQNGDQKTPDGQGGKNNAPQGDSGSNDKPLPNGTQQGNTDSRKPGQKSPNDASGGKQNENNTAGNNTTGNNKADNNSSKNNTAGTQSPDSARQNAQANRSGDNRGPKNSSEQPNQSANGGTKSDKPQSAGQHGDQSASGGSPQNSNQKPSGNQEAKSGPSGGNPQQPEKKTSGGAAGQEQLAQGSSNPPNTNPPGSQSGASQSMPGGKKPGDKPKSDSGNSDGGGSQTSQKKENKADGGKSGGGGEKPQDGQGEQKGSQSGNKPDNKGGDRDGTGEGEGQKDPGEHGDKAIPGNGKAPPDAQAERDGAHKPGDAQPGMNDKPGDAQSPAINPKESKSSSDTAGDRQGGGEGGGGQAEKKSGEGQSGSQSAANKGGSQSKDHGEGDTGNKPGGDVASSHPTGSSRKEPGKGNGDQAKPSDEQSNSNRQPSTGNSPQDGNLNQADGGHGTLGANPPQGGGAQTPGLPAGGGQSGHNGSPPPPASQTANKEPDKANLEYSNKQFDLALEHLKNEKNKPNSKLLDRLGWSKEEAQQFIDNLSKLKDAAEKPGNEAGKKAYNEFLENLDLHPHGTTVSGHSTKDENRDVRDSGQMEAPAEWADLSHAYSRGTAGQK